jgi:hypothetical protein
MGLLSWLLFGQLPGLPELIDKPSDAVAKSPADAVECRMAYSWFILLLTISGTALIWLLLRGTSLGQALDERIPDRPRRRLLVASLSFFLTFGGVRAVVYAILPEIPPFHFIEAGGRHIRHLVLGIIILPLVGDRWLCELGVGSDHSSIFLSRLMSILYGVGAVPTHNEFALWLNLKDVYWFPQGRSSIDAIILFGALLAAGSWGEQAVSADCGFANPNNKPATGMAGFCRICGAFLCSLLFLPRPEPRPPRPLRGRDLSPSRG